MTALIPTAALQPLKAAYSLRKVNPAYAGNCIQLRDSGNTLRALGFNADGSLNTTGLSGYGDGINFTVATWYDQSGNGYSATTATRPKLVFPNAPTNYNDAYIDFTGKSQYLATTATFLNVGGTENLAIFAVAGAFNFGENASSYTRASIAYVSGIEGAMLGYGTLSSGLLAHACYASTGVATMYAKRGTLDLDYGTPGPTRRRAYWWNQKGANVSGGSGSRTAFNDRPHGVAGATAQRLVIGNMGNVGQAMNGPMREVLIYQNATALTDTECRRISLGQTQAWASLTDAVFPDRYTVLFSGQSNALHYGAPTQSGNGTVGTDAITRIFTPDMNTRLGIPATAGRVLTVGSGGYAFGGTSIIKAAQPTGYWWDQDTDSAGPRLTDWINGGNGGVGFPGLVTPKYQRLVIMWAQGEQDVTYQSGNVGVDNVAAWKRDTKKVWAAMRAAVGYDCPIVIQPLGLVGSAEATTALFRAAQAELAAEVPGVTLGTATTDLERADGVHFSSSLQGPNQSANGYDLGATRLAAVIGPILSGMAGR